MKMFIYILGSCLSVLIVLMLMMLGFQWWTMVPSGAQVAKIYKLQLPKIIPQEFLMNELYIEFTISPIISKQI